MGEAISRAWNSTRSSTHRPNAVRITGTDGGSIMEYDEADQAFHVRTAHGSSEVMLEQLRAVTISRDATLVGRTADGAPLRGGRP